MTTISDLFDPGLLADMIDAKMIRRFEHNNGDLIGYDYTHRAQWEREWNPATLQCRGLITDTNGNIIARPFPKFFNLGERPDEDVRRIGQPFHLTEKLDGSLGIHYVWQGDEAIATRGSFHSSQAEWATAKLNEHGPPGHHGGTQMTRLFEIIYPDNRVVVDYGDRQGLYYLAAIDITTGRPVDLYWPLSQRAIGYQVTGDIGTVRGAWSHLDDGNFEGFVATYPDGHRVKIKLDEYVRLHRIMSSTSSRTIWEALKAGTGLDQIMASTPDEFMAWVETEAARQQAEYDVIELRARLAFDHGEVAGAPDRKAFAEAANRLPKPVPAVLFKMLDGRPYDEIIWKHLRPAELTYPPLGGGGGQTDVAA